MSSSMSTNTNVFSQYNFTPSTTQLQIPPFPISNTMNTSLTINNISSPHTNIFSISNPSINNNNINNKSINNSNKRKLDVPSSFMNKRRRIDSSPLTSTSTITKSPDSINDNTSNNNNNNTTKYRYSIDEKVLVWFKNSLYQSKIIKRKILNNYKKSYFIHYEGWSDRWDEWVFQDRILPYTKQNIELMKNKASKNGNILITKNNNHLLSQNKCKKSKEIRKKTKSKIGKKKIKNQNNNDKLFRSMSNDSNSSLLSLSISNSLTENEKYFELESKYNILARKQKETQNKCNKYKNIIEKLYNECVYGESPRWNLINTTDREERVTRDKELAILRSQIGSLYPKGNWEVSAIDKWRGRDELQIAVFRFVNLNGEYKVNAFAWLNGKIELLSNILNKYKIANHKRIPALNGQFGIKAKIDIPKNTCVGQYFGAEILQSAFTKVYDGTSEEYDHNIYAFDQTIDIIELKKLKEKREKIKQMRLKNNNKKNNNLNDESSDEIEIKKFIIDPFVGDWKDNELLLRWVNDCRGDIFENIEPTSEDKKYYNVEYVGMKVNGWPQAYLVTKRKIKKGEELMTYYGPQFGQAMQEQEHANQKRKKIQNRIDKNIMKDLKCELIKK